MDTLYHPVSQLQRQSFLGSQRLCRENLRKFSAKSAPFRVETKHRIARNLARIARKFTRSTKIEIEMLEKKFARFLLGSKEDRKFYARDRSDRNSMLEMIARKLKWKLDKEKLKMFALFVLWKWEKYVVFILLFKINTKLFQLLEIFYRIWCWQ